MLDLIQWIQEHGTAATAERIAKAEQQLKEGQILGEVLKKQFEHNEQQLQAQRDEIERLQGENSRLWGADEAAKELEAQVKLLSAPVSDEHKRWWHEDVRPIINAIGELSVQEAMDAIERSL